MVDGAYVGGYPSLRRASGVCDGGPGRWGARWVGVPFATIFTIRPCRYLELQRR
jgi:hypothetical protein